MSTKAYDTVKLARANKRPTGLDYIHNLCGDFFELHGDRCYADDGAIVGGTHRHRTQLEHLRHGASAPPSSARRGFSLWVWPLLAAPNGTGW